MCTARVWISITNSTYRRFLAERLTEPFQQRGEHVLAAHDVPCEVEQLTDAGNQDQLKLTGMGSMTADAATRLVLN